MMLLTNGSCAIPSPVDAVIDRCVWYPGDFRPLGYALGIFANGYKNVSSRVPGLLFSGGPSAITGFVSKVIVNPVKRVLITWGKANIINKARKIICPLVANGYAPSTVSIVRRARFVKTASLNGLPGGVFSRPRHPVRYGRLFGLLIPIATARTCFPVNNVFVENGSNNTAVAPANPTMITPFVRPSVFDHQKPTKLLSGKITNFAHCFLHAISINHSSMFSRAQ